MTGGHRHLDQTAGRFRDLVHARLLPGLHDLGFRDRLPGSLAMHAGNGVVWLLDLDVAPWSAPEKICFTIAWGVHVPGVEAALGDPAPEVLDIAACLVSGRVGERADRLDPTWFELRARARLVAAFADAALANRVLGAVVADVLPRVRPLASPIEVQAHLHSQLVTGRGVPRANELQTIRRIAGLSLLVGDRANAARWLDHLEHRSAVAMAPDVVAERLAPLRERLAS
jgi:hypothetical protein